MDRIIITDTQGREKAFFSELCEADIDIGGENDFSLTIPVNVWNEHEMGFDSRFYIPGTEIGGIIQDYTVITKDRSIKATGDVFRGLLKNHIIEPPEGEAVAQVITYPYRVAETQLLELPDTIELRTRFE